MATSGRLRKDIEVRNGRQTDRLFLLRCSRRRNTAGEGLFDGGLIYERMRLCKRRASCDNVRWGWYLSIWADLQQPQRHKSCHPTVHLSVAGPTRLFGPDSWTGADWGQTGGAKRGTREAREPQQEEQHSIPIRGEWAQRGPPSSGHGTARTARTARMGPAINWSSGGLTVSAETAVTARWAARQGSLSVVAMRLVPV